MLSVHLQRVIVLFTGCWCFRSCFFHQKTIHGTRFVNCILSNINHMMHKCYSFDSVVGYGWIIVGLASFIPFREFMDGYADGLNDDIDSAHTNRKP